MESLSVKHPGSKLFYVMGAPVMGITEPANRPAPRHWKNLNVELVGTQPTDWGAEQAMNVTQSYPVRLRI